MAITKTYSDLKELRLRDPKLKIGVCQSLLPNRMQCWRPADFQVSATSIVKNEDGSETTTTLTHQLCKHHAIVEQRQDEQAVPETPEQAVVVEGDTPAKQLKAQQAVAASQAMPVAEGNPLNK